MPYTGTGKILFAGTSYDVEVTLQPQSGNIEVRLPIRKNKPLLPLLTKPKMFDGTYEITDLRINFPDAKLSSPRVRDLLLTNYNAVAVSPFNSPLVTTFRLYKEDAGHIVFTFKPRTSLLRFKCTNLTGVFRSELIFHDVKLRTTQPITIRRGRIEISGLADPNFLSLRSKNNILRLRSSLQNALGILQGGPPTYRVGYYRENLEMNFYEEGTVQPIGLIFSDKEMVGPFISKFLEHESQIAGQDLHRWKLWLHYLIEGMNTRTPLENRVISLYTGLEIIDGTKTLNKNGIVSTLSVPNHMADVIAKTRNKLIHQGYQLSDSVKSSLSETRKHYGSMRTPFRSSNVGNHRLARIYYFYLLTRCLMKVIDTIGMPVSRLTYESYLR